MLMPVLLACHSQGGGHHPKTPTTSTTPVTPGTPTKPVTTTTPTVQGFQLRVDPAMVLAVHASFDDPGGSDEWLEYRFEGDEWLQAPVLAPGEGVILGLPPHVLVEARAVAVVDGVTWRSESLQIYTGTPPSNILLPQVNTWDPSLTSPENFAMISVSTGQVTYQGPWIIEILDRQGRLLWYHAVDGGLFSFEPHASLDGTHIWYEGEDIFGFANGDPGVTRQTLDGRWVQSWPLPGLGQAIAEGPDRSFFYEVRSPGRGVNQLDADGSTHKIWDCGAWMQSVGIDPGYCSLNTCNWDPTRNTVLASQFETSTVFEIDVATGEPIRQMGQLHQGDPYRFDPPDSLFAYQHDPYWTPEGTILVSTHEPCGSQPDCSDNQGRDGIQVAAEYTVDDATKTIHRIGETVSTDRWAKQAGEAYRLPNGNLVQGYGQNGAVRELTPDGTVAWDVSWPTDQSGYRVVGHLTLIDDLYALNQGL